MKNPNEKINWSFLGKFALSMFLLCGILFLIQIGCKREAPKVAEKAPPPVMAKSAADLTTCKCDNNTTNCKECVTKFLQGFPSRTFTVCNWDCTPPDAGTQCPPPSPCTTLTFCILEEQDNPCTRLCLTIKSPPSCLPCLSDGQQFDANIKCDPNNSDDYTVTFDNGGSGSSWTLNARLGDDPKMVITCTNDDGVVFKCTFNI